MGPGMQHLSQGPGFGLETRRQCPGHVGEKAQAILRWTSTWENPQPPLLVRGQEVQENKVATGICGVLA